MSEFVGNRTGVCFVGAKKGEAKDWGPRYLDSAGDPAPVFKMGRGRRSVRSEYLEHQRDAWIWLLEPAWVYIGRILESAQQPEDICKAFELLNSRSKSHLTDPFLRRTTEKSTVQSIARLLEECEQAGQKCDEANEDHKEKREEYEHAVRVSYSVGGELKLRLESDIAQRKKQLRLLRIAKSQTKGRLKKYSLLTAKYAKAKPKSRGTRTPFLERKLFKIEADIRADEQVNANSQSMLARITPGNRKLAMEDLQSRKAKLDLAVEALKQATATFDTLQTNLLDQEAFLYREELLHFIGSGKYSIEPRQIAKGLAGLPFMKSRRSAERLLRRESKAPTTPDYEVFVFIHSRWKNRTRRGDLPLVEWFKEGIVGLPKWVGKGEDRSENPLRMRLAKYWYFLERALEEVQALKFGQIPQPYFIAQRFLEHSLNPEGVDSILANRERITT